MTKKRTAVQAQMSTIGWLEQLSAMKDIHISLKPKLATYTSFGIGGPADVLVQVQTRESLIGIANVLRLAELPCTVLGGGTNVLVSDQGVAGIVLQLGKQFNYTHVDSTQAEKVIWQVGGSTKTSELVSAAVRAGLSGVEGLAGVPGWVGGAVAMNAGGRDGCIGSVIRKTEVFWQGQVAWWPAERLRFSYRCTALPKGAIVLSVEMELAKDQAEQVQARVQTALERRRHTQPIGMRCAGSIFMNPIGKYAGQLIEQAGCKGFQEGDAEVSQKHANFIVNRHQATSTDVLKLIRRVQQAVQHQCGLHLQLEVRLLGRFKPEELA